MIGPDDTAASRPPAPPELEREIAIATAGLLMAFWTRAMVLRESGMSPVVIMRAIEKSIETLQTGMAVAEVESGRQWGT